MTKRTATQAEQGLRAKLQGLARFAPIFASPGFQFGAWHCPPPDPSGILTFPSCALSHEAIEFVQVAYDLGWVGMFTFQWSEWKDRPEGKALMENPDRIAAATPDQLAKLLTVYIRGDRFNEGLLNSAFESGVLTAIVKRAEALLQSPPFAGVPTATWQ